MTVKERIKRLLNAREANKDAEVIAVMQSGERRVMKWMDAVHAAIRGDAGIDHFEDCAPFYGCASLPTAILGTPNLEGDGHGYLE